VQFNGKILFDKIERKEETMKLIIPLHKKFLFLPLLLFSGLSFISAKAENFILNKDFVRIETNAFANNPLYVAPLPHQTVVIEFFNYACHFCNQFEPAFSAWNKHKPASIQVTRIAVSFNAAWQIFAKAFYVADALNSTEKMTPLLFHAIHQENRRFSSESDLITFFREQGINQPNLENAFSDSLSLSLKLKQADQLLGQMGANMIPTVVVNGKYRTDLGMAGGSPERMIAIINFLIGLSHQRT